MPYIRATVHTIPKSISHKNKNTHTNQKKTATAILKAKDHIGS